MTVRWASLWEKFLSGAKELLPQRPAIDRCHLGRIRPWRSGIVAGLVN
jgi:hypothetical protein